MKLPPNFKEIPFNKDPITWNDTCRTCYSFSNNRCSKFDHPLEIITKVEIEEKSTTNFDVEFGIEIPVIQRTKKENYIELNGICEEYSRSCAFH